VPDQCHRPLPDERSAVERPCCQHVRKRIAAPPSRHRTGAIDRLPTAWVLNVQASSVSCFALVLVSQAPASYVHTQHPVLTTAGVVDWVSSMSTVPQTTCLLTQRLWH
jgi:hypothetical protein